MVSMTDKDRITALERQVAAMKREFDERRDRAYEYRQDRIQIAYNGLYAARS